MNTVVWILGGLVFIPSLEIYGILLVGDWVGGWNTFLLMLLTGIVGAAIARYEVVRVWGEAQKQLQFNQVPGRAVIDGLCIMAGGIMLLIPGFLTDMLGFSLLFPITRSLYRDCLLKWIEKKIKSGGFTVFHRF